ncbi:MAG: VOC family protein [Bacteroidales bacterium]|nr:VOC family protein [Bacteroidales bacterium]
MPGLNFCSTVIFVKNIEASMKFYIEILNQVIKHDFGLNIMFKSNLSLWQISDSHEISSVAGSSNKENKFELYFETDDIDKEASRLKLQKVKFFHDIKTEPWGQKTIRFFDPDSHLIEIGEEFSIFLRRIFLETGSLKETSRKTGVQVNLIRETLKLSK